MTVRFENGHTEELKPSMIRYQGWSCPAQPVRHWSEREVTMTTDHADYGSGMPTSQSVSVDELFRNVPVQSARDLTCDGIFDSDEELDEFLAHVRNTRGSDLA